MLTRLLRVIFFKKSFEKIHGLTRLANFIHDFKLHAPNTKLFIVKTHLSPGSAPYYRVDHATYIDASQLDIL